MSRLMTMALSALAVMTVVGCSTPMLGGGGRSGAQFKATVSQVYNSAMRVLKDETMPIIRQATTKDTAEVESQYSNGTSVKIAIRAVAPEYTHTDITVGAAGENYRAYDLMKKIEAHL